MSINVIKKATNRWTKGLVMDFSPENTSNELLTNALNATLLTFNGNELSLQNDMGNARVETAFLPEGYIPVGTCEYGGIIYIVSYNPLEDKSQIGCFPSPERNISRDELGESNSEGIQFKDFQDVTTDESPNGNIVNTTKYVLLRNSNLNPGDKFIITANPDIYDEALAGLLKKDDQGNFNQIEDPMLALNIVSIEDSGKITYLNSDLIRYNKNNYKYHILGEDLQITDNAPNIDDYRNTVSSGYNVFKSKISGKLAILAELIMIDSYSVTHSIDVSKAPDLTITAHTTVSYDNTYEKYNSIPKVSYFYLQDSQGYIPVAEGNTDDIQYDIQYGNGTYQRPLFINQGGQWKSNEYFSTTKLKDVYVGGGDETFTGFTFNVPESYYKAENKDDEYTKYKDLTLGSVTIPQAIYEQKKKLLFKYDYTLLPCMKYGKLSHLAVHNTIDFSNLFNFDASNFTTWKYHIDGNQLRITVGAEVYDAFSDVKVDALILEFYDAWGFSGSLVISGYQSYSGTFTKIVNLNSLNALSKNQIVKEDDGSFKLIDTYVRNANSYIKEDSGSNKYYYGYDEITHVPYSDQNSYYGWQYNNSGDALPNDCGILYPNLIYGVKAYFRTINENNEYSYIYKKDLFLYTLPIYNDYYYTEDDFSTLVNPKLDFVLTFRLQNQDQVLDYSSDDIQNGYSSVDKNILNNYSNGTQSKDFSVVKYKTYKGTSNLFLEVGLKQDYQDLAVSCDQNLNSKFSCTLKLNNLEKSDQVIKIAYDTNKQMNLVNAIHQEDPYDLQALVFNNNTHTLTLNDISNYNFINNSNPQPLEISYEFTVGYKINVKDIRQTEVQATTICALCHQKSNGEYNLEDFGVYKKGNDYLPSVVIANGGNTSSMKFGICRMVDASPLGNVTMDNQCRVTEQSSKTPELISGPRLFNTGKPNDLFNKYIPKLTFCSPHAHSVLDVSVPKGESSAENWGDDASKGHYHGVNIWGTTDGGWGISVAVNDQALDKGRAPSNALFNYPLYNMVCHTQNSIDSNSEFISNILYESGLINQLPYLNKNGYVNPPATMWPCTKFTGISAQAIAEFNKGMIETMKSVYAYNPDYNSLQLYQGDVSIEDNAISFNSNILSTDAKFDITNLNDYIYMYHMNVSDYLNNLSTYSNIKILENDKIIPQLEFKPNYKYCGASGEYSLLTSLTYNTPVPDSINNEFNVYDKNSITIKHQDGTYEFITGQIDKNILYGYKDGHLIQLDVTNYEIDDEGKLTVTADVTNESSIIHVQPTKGWYNLVTEGINQGYYSVVDTYKVAQLKLSNITLNDLVYRGNNEKHRLYMRNTCGSDFIKGNVLWYRNFNASTFRSKDKNTYDKNGIRLLAGPCYIPT